MIVRGDACRLPFSDASCDLVIGSPPYLSARSYLENGNNLGISRELFAWTEWMLAVTEEALRVSKGLVVWVVAGITRDRCYQPGPEGLLWEAHKRGIHSFRPVIWYRSGIPGSGGDEWYRADTEYCLAFKRPGKLLYANPKANGHIPKYAPGGEMSHYNSSGMRVNQWGNHSKKGTIRSRSGEMVVQNSPSHVYVGPDEPSMDMFGEPIKEPERDLTVGQVKSGRNGLQRTTNRNGQKSESHAMNKKYERVKRQPDGTEQEQSYDPPAIANPGNLLKIKTGGGAMGHVLAHENEAAYPVDVPRFFINSHCPPGGLVLDPFAGSSTTGHAALELGRRYIGMDLRQSQCLLSRRRLATVTPGFVFSETTG